MKHYIYAMALMAAMATTSCSSTDEPVEQTQTPVGTEQSVTFTIDVPADIRSRANDAEDPFFGDGKEVTHILAAVYDNDFEDDELGEYVYHKVFEWNPVDGKQTVTLDFNIGACYNVVFLAFYNDKTPSIDEHYFKYFDFDKSDAIVELGMEFLNNTDECDMFYYTLREYEPTFGGNAQSITLKHMFAQVNIGCEDQRLLTWTLRGAEVAGEGENLNIYLKTYTTFDLFSETPGDLSDITIYPKSSPDKDKMANYPIVPGDEQYEYLTMFYVLAPGEDIGYNINFGLGVEKYKGETFKTFDNIPVRRNWRTNIYGNNGAWIGNGVFNVTINPEFEFNTDIVK